MGFLSDMKKRMSPAQERFPEDDFRIVQSWAEYEEDTAKTPEYRNLKFLCYELEVMNPETGERTHFYKAVKFARVHRLPANAKHSTAFMDMQEQVLAGVYERGYNFVTIIANIMKPAAVGLIFLYGIQGASKNLQEAKDRAESDFLGFIGMMQGTFRVLEMKCAEAQETEWLREKMYGMDYLTAVRGIPKASKAGEDAGNRGMGGMNLNPDSQGTLEEIIAGMADYEYVIEVLSTPVYIDTLLGWQRQSQKEMTEWYGQLQGQKSLSMSLSIPMMYMANTSQSQGWSKAYTDADTISYAEGESFSASEGQSVGESLSQSFSESAGHSQGQSLSSSVSHGASSSRSISAGASFSQNEGISAGAVESYNEGASHSVNQSQNIGLTEGVNVSRTEGISEGSSYNLSHGRNAGVSHSLGQSQNAGYSQSESVSAANSATYGQNVSSGVNAGKTYGSSFGESFGSSSNHNIGNSYGQNYTNNEGSSISAGISGGLPLDIANVNGSYSRNHSVGIGENIGSSIGYGTGTNSGISYGETSGASVGSSISRGESISLGETVSHGKTIGTSQGFAVSENYGTSRGESLTEGWGVNQSQNHSRSIGQSASRNLSSSFGEGEGYTQGIGRSQNTGQSYGIGEGRTIGENYGISETETIGQSVGRTVSDSVTESRSAGYGQNVSLSESITGGQSYTESTGSSQGRSVGTTGAAALGSGSSMGIGPGIGYSKSYQWMNQGVKDLLELMEYQNERIKKAIRGQGAFYSYVYIGCPDTDALSAAQALAKSAWQNEYAMVQPLQVLDLSEVEQKHLLYHFAAFSSDITKEDVCGIREYKYCTVLLPEEFVAYTHLPRISEGGVFTIVQDIPKFSVPSGLKGEIYMGTILNPERYTFRNGYRTPYDYRIDESVLMHGFFTGASRSGKTVAAMRFIAELSRVRRMKSGKRLRIAALDPKQDWRTLARFIEPERFKFWSMGNINFRPIRINPWKVPRGVWPQLWIDGIIDIYCRAYGLLERGKQMLADVVFELYEEAGVFEACNKGSWKEEVPELSRAVNFTAIYKRMFERKENLENPFHKGGRPGNDTRDAYARLLDRLSCFDREYSIERRLYGSSEGIGIDELIGDDDVTVLESKGLENTFKNFIFGAITSGFYKYALAHEGGYLAEDQYETVLVIEEANEVLTGNDAAGTGGGEQFGMSGQSEFEQLLDQAAGYGLFVFAITQKIADMPSSVIANSGLIFAGKLKRPEDINVVVRAIGREERIDDRDTVKWFPRSPTGQFVCQTSRTFDFKDAEPILVQISRLNISPPSNLELDEILTQKKAMEHLQQPFMHTMDESSN